MVRERVKNAQLQKQIDQQTFREPNLKVSELTNELAELTKCFEKSEMIRKQQKILINKMKLQIEGL